LIDAAIFDLDGTLIDLPIDYDKLIKEIERILKKENVRPLLKTVKEADERERREIFRVWNEIELEAIPRTVQVEDGMNIYKEYCDKLKALVTLQGETVVNAILENLGLLFAFSITREQSLDREKQLEIALRKLKTSAHNVMFVGNEDHDREAARKIGCQFRRVGQRKSGMTLLQANI
jgi:phosphoglycolate phosphatase-like HAD superfamily hydrolase